MNQSPRIVSVNVGVPRSVEWGGRTVTSAIWKSPVDGRIALHGVNFDGDDQADRRVHGGTDKAVYAYASEDYAWWSEHLAVELAPGTFGENLTTEGIDLGASVIGQCWHVGSAVLEVSQPRQPCYKLGMRMGDAKFVDVFDAAARPGAYLRVVREGDIGAGDEIGVDAPPGHGLTIAALNGAQRGAPRELFERIVAIDAVPEGWRAAGPSRPRPPQMTMRRRDDQG